ncbi:hypothetical protein LIER_12761 [Lithospermum erythrorhizon]|uniref:Uncharacterized protein n=1 Tax=Lithospermum erythrorhizon TaxID=34254 RepID=A0AAV3PY59_LITER
MPVPQQSSRSNSCGWFVKSFIQEWNGETYEMRMLRRWKDLNMIQMNQVVKFGRDNMCLEILKSVENDYLKKVMNAARSGGIGERSKTEVKNKAEENKKTTKEKKIVLIQDSPNIEATTKK